MTPLSERLIEVIDDKQTGETLLDETLKIMKGQQATERLGVNTWIDLLSGKLYHHYLWRVEAVFLARGIMML